MSCIQLDTPLRKVNTVNFWKKQMSSGEVVLVWKLNSSRALARPLVRFHLSNNCKYGERKGRIQKQGVKSLGLEQIEVHRET